MPRVELTFRPRRRRNSPPVRVIVNPLSDGEILIEFFQAGESAYLGLTPPQWIQLIDAVQAAMKEKS